MSPKQATLSQSGESVSHQQQLKNIDLELLGERIRQARIDQKISQRDLCKGLFTSAYLSYVELGKTRPTLANLEKLATRLSKPVDYFLRPSGLITAHKAQGGLDREQLRNLELQNQLLQTQVALSGNDLGQVEHMLTTLKPFLPRLNRLDQAQYNLMEGGFYNSLNETEPALAAFQAARTLLDNPASEADNSLLAQLDLETGIAYVKADQHIKALDHFQKGMDRARQATKLINGNVIYRRLLWETSRAYTAVGDPDRAFEYSQRLLDFPTETRSERAGSLFNEGVRLAGLGDYQQASFFLGRSEQLWLDAKEITALQEVTVENAEIHLQAKKYPEAYKAARLAYRLITGYPSDSTTKRAELKVLLLLVQITLHLNDLGAVKSYMEQAERLNTELKTDDPLDKARYFYVAGNAMARLDSGDKATDFYRQAIELLEPMLEHDADSTGRALLSEVYYNASQLLKKRNDSARALEYLDKAFRLRTK